MQFIRLGRDLELRGLHVPKLLHLDYEKLFH